MTIWTPTSGTLNKTQAGLATTHLGKAFDTTPKLKGQNIIINAEFLNVNGLIQSGDSDYVININAATATEILGLGDASVKTILKPASSDIVDVYWDPKERRIEVEKIRVSGGKIVINYKVLNTGNGEIHALGGYANITINNTTSYDLNK